MVTAPRRVGVLMGGESPEREVSLRSGANVVAALRSKGYDVAPMDVRESALDSAMFLGIDVAFIALHGGAGEDGRVQRWLADRGIAYTGSDPYACLLAMDKWAAKRLFEQAGGRTPAAVLVHPREAIGEVLDRVRPMGFPVVVKPVAAGSSVGVTVGVGEEELAGALSEAFRYGASALVERFIEGREMTVGVLFGKALPPVEIRPARAFFDYRAKYEDAGTQYLVPAEIERGQGKKLARASLAAHKALHLNGMSRVDAILGRDGEVYVLEVNAIPGMTERSLLPKAARAAGWDFADVCDRLVREAWKRRPKG